MCILQAHLGAILHASGKDKAMEGLKGAASSADGGRQIEGFLGSVASAFQKTRELAAGLQTIGCGGIDVAGQVNDLFSEHLETYPQIEFDLLEVAFLSHKVQHKGKELCYDVIEQYVQSPLSSSSFTRKMPEEATQCWKKY